MKRPPASPSDSIADLPAIELNKQCFYRSATLTGDTLPVGVGLSITGVGVGGGAVVHTAQQGAQVAHGHLLYEGGAILPEVPPLEDLGGENG